MSSYFYDGQVRRYLVQFMRVLSNFSYKDAKGQLVQVPVRYGDMNRQVAQILRKNSENSIPSAPLIACYIKDINFDRARMQDPTFVSKINVREREYNEATGQYLDIQGANYTVERIMPSPFEITFAADIWTTNTDQKMQLWEQIAVIFNPSLEIQTTDNYIDWTSLSVLNLESQTWSSRTIPQGLEQDIDILNMVFKAPVWITPPAKVKKLGIITKIITDVHAVGQDTIAENYGNPLTQVDFSGDANERVTVSPGNFDLLILNNTATLLKWSNGAGDDIDISDAKNKHNWHSILSFYPGKFRAGYSQLRLQKPEGGEIVAYISLNPTDDHSMQISIDQDTVPSNTVIAGRGTVDAIVNPETFNPSTKSAGTRYLILEDININDQFGGVDYSGPVAWKNADDSDFQAHGNDVIEWDGTEWSIVFDSTTSPDTTYITNIYTNVQYKWDGEQWSKSFEGVYDNGTWRLIL